jgi:manganese efflux pump family protein
LAPVAQLSIFTLAIGLAADATAVAASRGMAVPVIVPRHVLLVAGFFGGFQALMPLGGWLIGNRLGPHIQAWDHWVIFLLLSCIGAKMLWEGREAKASEPEQREDVFATRVVFVLAIATSLDALAAGITLPLLDAPIVLSLITIGVITAVLSALGLFAGRKFGAMLGPRLDAVGGLVLIGLGLKILLEHLRAG